MPSVVQDAGKAGKRESARIRVSRIIGTTIALTLVLGASFGNPALADSRPSPNFRQCAETGKMS